MLSDETEQILMRVLAEYENELGPDHTSTLDTVQCLGVDYSIFCNLIILILIYKNYKEVSLVKKVNRQPPRSHGRGSNNIYISLNVEAILVALLSLMLIDIYYRLFIFVKFPRHNLILIEHKIMYE